VFAEDWGKHPSSCQHIFTHVARKYPVVWTNTIGMRNPRATWQDLQKAARKIKSMIVGETQPEAMPTKGEGITVCQPPMLPYSNYRLVRAINRVTVRMTVQSVLRKRSLGRPVLVTTVPNACDFINDGWHSAIVYYCVDDFAEWPGLEKPLVQEMERKLIRKADVFVATSHRLFARLRREGKPTYFLPHGVDFDLFSSSPQDEHACLRGIPRPRVGYYGLFDERCDQALIREVAERLPGFAFVMTGPVAVETIALRNRSNIYFTGPVNYEELPALIKGIDVLVIPYSRNELTESISPLKLKEYLASGKPIVSTSIPETQFYDGLVTCIVDAEDMSTKIRESAERADPDRAAKIKELLANESWKRKAEELIAICRESRLVNYSSDANRSRMA